MCRLCGRITESIEHLSSGCSVLAPREYTNRHNLVANIIHQALHQKMFPTKPSVPCYKYKPTSIVENRDSKLYWDMSVITDTNIQHNRPDILVLSKHDNPQERKAIIFDVTIPLDDNIHDAYVEKIRKYQDLKQKIAQIYNQSSVSIIPIVISANGLIHKNLKSALESCGLKNPEYLIGMCQKSVILSTTSIIRKCLSMDVN
ncbi:hypothetical protein M8J77_019495 [Diaphorina citri]|nr:hypothetical protein M8J77_019495 [Diaphorina citri]